MDAETKSAFELLEKLVSLPSVTPASSPSADFSEKFCGESRMAGFLCGYASREGLAHETVMTPEGRPSVIIRLPSDKAPADGPLVALFAHMDTVWAPSMETPFRLRLQGGNAHGLGSCDDKASIAAGLLALTELKSLRGRPCSFALVATADEESGFTGVRTLVPKHIRPDFAIVGEPTSLKLATAHKGVARWEFTTAGESVHASLVPKGRNAIYMAAAMIRIVQEHLGEIVSQGCHPLLGARTLNVGKISGGSLPNVIPDSCSFCVERRLLPGETSESALGMLRAVLDASGTPYSVRETFYVPAFEISPEDTFPAKLARTVRNFRPASEIVGLTFATEAAYLALHGIPCSVFGPGDIAIAHSPAECVPLEEIIQAKRIVISFLTDYISGN